MPQAPPIPPYPEHLQPKKPKKKSNKRKPDDPMDVVDDVEPMVGDHGLVDSKEDRAARARLAAQARAVAKAVNKANRARTLEEKRALANDDYWVKSMASLGILEEDEDFFKEGQFDEQLFDEVKNRLMTRELLTMKRLRAATRLLKRVRKYGDQDKSAALPGWHILPGERRIWTNPYAVSGEVAYPLPEGVSTV